MNNHSPALEVQGLTKAHGSGPAEVTALEAIDVSFSRGSFTAVMGPSGSGKSTLLNCAACLDRPTAGSTSSRFTPANWSRTAGARSVTS
jgi:putative ABC transport system ATP-binding protein